MNFIAKKIMQWRCPHEWMKVQNYLNWFHTRKTVIYCPVCDKKRSLIERKASLMLRIEEIKKRRM